MSFENTSYRQRNLFYVVENERLELARMKDYEIEFENDDLFDPYLCKFNDKGKAEKFIEACERPSTLTIRLVEMQATIVFS